MKNNINTKYVHEEEVHNLIAPREIVPIVFEIINPKSVVDIGCGLGTFLYVFKERGVKEVLGVDGKWVDKTKLGQYLDEKEFLTADLELLIDIKKQFDLAVCLEVAEHLPEKSAETLVKSLTSLSKHILFSAAIPFQGGQNHINEQSVAYWKKKFAKHDFIFHDIIRPKIWNNPNVFVWYKQNIFFVAHKDSPLTFEIQPKYFDAYHTAIHPELFTKKMQELTRSNDKTVAHDEILIGKQKLGFYLKLLAKWGLRKINGR